PLRGTLQEDARTDQGLAVAGIAHVSADGRIRLGLGAKCIKEEPDQEGYAHGRAKLPWPGASPVLRGDRSYRMPPPWVMLNLRAAGRVAIPRSPCHAAIHSPLPTAAAGDFLTGPGPGLPRSAQPSPPLCTGCLACLAEGAAPHRLELYDAGDAPAGLRTRGGSGHRPAHRPGQRGLHGLHLALP